jgi:hypothetical protein
METDPLKYTSIETIAPTIERLRNSFRTHKTKTKEWRVRNLNALKQACLENKDDLTLSVQKDLHQDLLFATNEAIGKSLRFSFLCYVSIYSISGF